MGGVMTDQVESFETGIAAAGSVAEFLAVKIKEAEEAFGMQAVVVVMLGSDNKARPAFIGTTPAHAADLCIIGAECLLASAEEISESMRKDQEALCTKSSSLTNRNACGR